MGRDEIPSIPSQFCHSKTNRVEVKPRSTTAFSMMQGVDSQADAPAGTDPLVGTEQWEVTAERHPGSSPLLKRVPWRHQRSFQRQRLGLTAVSHTPSTQDT